MLKQSSADEQPAGQSEPTLALPDLFAAEETPLLQYAFSLIRRRAIAEEIVQEVFLQLHANWTNVQDPRGWLYRSVRNRAFNHVRNNRREVLADDSLIVTEDGEETAEAIMLRMEAAGVLRQTIDRLEDSDRQLVEMKYFDGLTYRQISEQTGLSVGNVGYRLHHILKRLATSLRSLGLDDET